jgi:hypothetical protein
MRKNIVWTVLYMLVTVASAGGCGNSSGDRARDTMTVTISSPSGPTTTRTYEEGSYSSNNPYLRAYITALNEVQIEFHYWDGVSVGSTEVLNMLVMGNTPGLYSVDPGFINSSIMYSSNGPAYDNLRSSTGGTIILSAVGNIGENITGTFDTEVVSLLETNTTDTLRITGSFRITRD